jgi:thioredoxin reductase
VTAIKGMRVGPRGSRPDASTRPSRRGAWDVVIVGAGPAGLSAALILARACRRVLLCDTGTPRSWASKRMHGFLTREGISPAEFRKRAHRELKQFPNLEFVSREVTNARRQADGSFVVKMGRRSVRCRKLLIATGVFDHLPKLDGIDALFGTSVFQCPYCDGWEVRGEPVAVYGKQRRGLEIARAMTAWTDDILLCSDGRLRLGSEERAALERNGIELVDEPIARLEGRHGRLQRIVFRSGREEARTALFFDMPSSEQSSLAESLGCQFTHKGGVRCGQHEATTVPGVFVAGNIIKDVQLAIVAAAEGARAAFGINRALTREEFDRNATGVRRMNHPSIQGR